MAPSVGRRERDEDPQRGGWWRPTTSPHRWRMTTSLQIRNTVHDYDSWKAAFDKFERFRADHGVRSYRVLRRADDDRDVQVILDFDSAEAAVEFRGHLEQIWQHAAVTGPAGRPRRAGAARGRRPGVLVEDLALRLGNAE